MNALPEKKEVFYMSCGQWDDMLDICMELDEYDNDNDNDNEEAIIRKIRETMGSQEQVVLMCSSLIGHD
jgi:hypothetical protein